MPILFFLFSLIGYALAGIFFLVLAVLTIRLITKFVTYFFD